MNIKTGFFRFFISLFILSAAAQDLSSQKSEIQAFPPKDVTSAMDQSQMLWQLGIKLPQLPPKLQDPNRPQNAWPSDKANPEGNWTDEAKHTITRSAFGLWNNYSDTKRGFFPGPDTARLGNYSPINLLKMKDGKVIKTANEWWNQRRPEILKDLQEELYGKIPADSILPKVSWNIVTTSGGSGTSAYIQKEITGTLDISRYPEVRNKPVISATLRTPANVTDPVPVMIFFGGFGNAAEMYWNRSNPAGWGICVFNLGALQPDNGAGLTSYLIGLVNKGNWRKPNDWGTLVAWSWGVSRLIDYFETDKAIDSKIIGLTGHSRYGKATLVTMAYEPRVTIGFPSDGGSLGTKMNRRHWGQDLENSTGANEYHWMAGTFFKWAGEKTPGQYLPRKIEDCPVDAHSLLALCAPRPVLLNGGTSSSWTDPYGQYLTTLYASPVYELLGKKGIVMNDAKPIIDKAYIDGGIAFRYHNGGHTDAPEWPAFFEFAARHFDITTNTTSERVLTLDAKPVNPAYFINRSNREWTISASEPWLKTEKVNGDSVKVTAAANRGKSGRTALLTISMKGRTSFVTVNQASAKPKLDAIEKNLKIGEKAGDIVSFDIKSNTAWKVFSTANWVTISDEAGILNKTIIITATPNTRVESRKLSLILSAPGVSGDTILLTQLAGLPTLNIMQQTVSLRAAAGSTGNITVMSNTNFSVKCSETWLTASISGNNNFRQVVVTAQENSSLSDRSAKVIVTVEGLPPRIVEVIQKKSVEE
jgi:hypothetical protein